MASKVAIISLLGCIMACVVNSTAPPLVRKIPKPGGHHTETAAIKDGGKVPSVWMTFPNKHVNPVCSNYEFRTNFGVKDSLEECLDAVKSAERRGNVGVWQRGLDRNCYSCDLLRRSKATSLSYIDSPHVDTFVHVETTVRFYENDGNQFMKTPGQWRISCWDLPNNTGYISTKYGSRMDYFKPLIGETFCSMLRSNQRHLWRSSTPTDGDDQWNEPPNSYVTGDMEFCGGNAGLDSSGNQVPGVDGEIGTWCTMRNGQGDPRGGMRDGVWNQPFEMFYTKEYEQCSVVDGTAFSSKYPCECGNTHCSDGEACAEDISRCADPEALPNMDTSGGNTTGGNTTGGNTTGGNTTGGSTSGGGSGGSNSGSPTASPTPGPSDETTTTVGGTTTTVNANATSTAQAQDRARESQSHACPATGFLSRMLSVSVAMWLSIS